MDWKKEVNDDRYNQLWFWEYSSYCNHIQKLNIDYQIIDKPEELEKAEKLVLPGVGAFDETIQHLIDSGLKDKLNELVLEKKYLYWEFA